MNMNISYILLLLIFICRSNALNSFKINEKTCNPTKPNSLNVHIISHTHLDAGWVKTFKEYYNQSVKSILNTVIASLTSDEGLETRKFSFVEVSYFDLYWNDISDEERDVITKLVRDKKLQFVSGGWVMNDEATPHYSMIIDNIALGHHWINRTFGKQYLPKTGWQVDPFGHSREFSSILSQMGFNGLFLGRIDYQDHRKRESNKNLEFIWKSDPNLMSNNYLFTSVLPTGYNPLQGFCYDKFCGYLEQTNPDINISSREFIDLIKSQSKNYSTNHLIATMGGDFFYTNASKWFPNLDNLINTVNSQQNEVHLLYSTPDCYLKSLKDLNKIWNHIKTDDFLPYADFPDAFWSGFYTSRPTFKRYINYANNILQISKQLIVFADIYSTSKQWIKPLQESVAIALHHDAISGTSKQYVIEDYKRMLDNGIFNSQVVITNAYQKLMKTSFEPQFCHNLNISQCSYTENISDNDILKITIYHPLAHSMKYYLSLPIAEKELQIIDSNGNNIKSQIVSIPTFIQTLSERNSTANYDIYFEATLPPLSFVNFFMQKRRREKKNKMNFSEKILPKTNTDIIISNNKFQVVIDKRSGLLKAIRVGDQSIEISQNFYYYTTNDFPKSGAYAMHTNTSDPILICEKAYVSVIRGNLVEEVRQEFNPWLSQVIRLYRNTDYIEFDWMVGPLRTDHDMEIVTRFQTKFKTMSTFYTDSNGRQTIKRIRDFRETWNLVAKEKVTSNYYPINSWIFIRDMFKNLQLSVLPDRPQGGTSLKDGSVELMIHRRLSRDDGYGMEEALNEKGFDGKGLVARGKHTLIIDKVEDSMKNINKMSKQLFLRPLTMFTKVSEPQLIRPDFSLSKKLDENIHILTLEEINENSVLLRIEYLFESNVSKSQILKVSLNELFSGFEVLDAIETSLTGIESVSDVDNRKFKWNCEECLNNEGMRHNFAPRIDTNDKYEITLYPNQIRTFLLKIKRNREL